MVEIKAVPDPAPDPKAGKPRSKSGVSFPYYDIDRSVDVVRVMHDKAGGSCDRAQLAALLNYSGVKNGGFLSRVAAAKMFGFIDEDDNRLRVTRRGQATVAPINDGDAERARAEAFMSVELFRKVFDRFNGQNLPAHAGLSNLLLNEYMVFQYRVAPTLKIMLDSADQAGLFRTAGNRSRMVTPLLPAQSAEASRVGDAGKNNGHSASLPPTPAGRRSGGGGDEPPDIHPAILGLLTDLPPAGTMITEKKRTSLIAAFTGLVGYLYPEADQ